MSDRELRELLGQVAEVGAGYRESLASRSVRATISTDALRRALGGPLPANGVSAESVIDALSEAAKEGTVASAGPRYFGFVTGGSTPAALAADWLVSVWDQNTSLYVMSPLVSVIEEVTAGWLCELLRLPAHTSVGFVTGCQMANFTALAAARHRVLHEAGWDVETEGLNGAPDIDVLISEEAHYTVALALRMLGFGTRRLKPVPTDAQGRMQARALGEALRGCSGPCIVCAQAGNVNTGAFDPIAEIVELAKERGAWLHVDGAFGLWAAASPPRAGLVHGVEHADSIATDGHKWLNVPYDCGIVFCADQAAHRGAMSMAAPYIASTVDERDPHEFVPESSRRGRAVTIYAALRSLGRSGLGEIVERNCRQAQTLAAGLRAAGYEVLNEVVLNQVLVAFGSDERTRHVIRRVQEDGTCWCGGTTWHGRAGMRISVSNWSTGDRDIEQSLEAIIRAARGH